MTVRIKDKHTGMVFRYENITEIREGIVKDHGRNISQIFLNHRDIPVAVFTKSAVEITNVVE